MTTDQEEIFLVAAFPLSPLSFQMDTRSVSGMSSGEGELYCYITILLYCYIGEGELQLNSDENCIADIFQGGGERMVAW